MTRIYKFEEIISRQKSKDLYVDVFKTFRTKNDYAFINQIHRDCISIPNNIAEWFERKSNNEFKYFLYVSKWSCGEARSMLYMAKELQYIWEDVFDGLYNKTVEISKLLSWLIKKL